VVLWGARESLDSSRHIYRGFSEVLRKLAIAVDWVADEPRHRQLLTPGTLVFAYDIWGAHIGPAIDGVQYLLHNFDGEHLLQQTVEYRNLVRLQTYTNQAVGVEWSPCRYWLQEGHVLFQPWGTNLLAEEFAPPVFNGTAKECAFVGAHWDDGGLGNVGTLPVLAEVLRQRGLQFNHLTQISEQEMIAAVRRSRIAPSLQGQWQVDHDYLACRTFKNVSLGQAAVTNVNAFHAILPLPVSDGSVAGIVDSVLALKAGQYLELVREQQRAVARFTYREWWENVARAFEEAARD
jgi:hypothetical protein